MEGNEDSDDGLDDEDDEEFIPNVGLVSLTLNKLLFSSLQKIFKSEKTINFCQDLVNKWPYVRGVGSCRSSTGYAALQF